VSPTGGRGKGRSTLTSLSTTTTSYYPGRDSEGIYVAPLKPDDISKFAAAPTHLIGFNKELS
jgi:hypothetical protein